MQVLKIEEYKGKKREVEIVDLVRKIQDANKRAEQVTQELKELTARLNVLMLDNETI